MLGACASVTPVSKPYVISSQSNPYTGTYRCWLSNGAVMDGDPSGNYRVIEPDGNVTYGHVDLNTGSYTALKSNGRVFTGTAP
jgi:hypothetical protein